MKVWGLRKVLAGVTAATLLIDSGAVWGQATPDKNKAETADTSAPAEIRVQGSRPVPPNVNPTETFDQDFIVRTDAFTVDEVLTKLTPTLPGTQQIVLINGRESLMDPATIPAEMIERIDVNSSGVRPDGRPRVVGTVINIILKQDYTGANFSVRQRGSFEGGGAQNQLNSWGAYTSDKLSGRFSVTRRAQDSLFASERDFSRDQNHVDQGGTDYRLQYGTPAVVQAVSGPLNGVVDGNGVPVSVALVPETPLSGSLTPGDFIAGPAGVTDAAGLRRFNTADSLYLTAPSEANSVSGEVGYAFRPELKLRAGYNFSRTNSRQSGAPPITAASGNTLVPAALNPFGQDVEIGLVHTGFGPTRRETRVDRSGGFFAGEGKFGDTWTWNAQLDMSQRTLDSETRDLDAAKFAAALQATDPAQRFDPFASVAPGSANAALYPDLVRVRASDAVSDDTRLRFNMRGRVSEGWVAPVFLGVGAERLSNDTRQHLDSAQLAQPAFDSRSRLDSTRAFATLEIPVFKVRELATPATLTTTTHATLDEQRLNGQQSDIDTVSVNNVLYVPWFEPGDEKPGVYQLATQIGAGLTRSEGETDDIESAGVIWSPTKPVTLRVDYSRQIMPPSLLQYSLAVDYNQTLVDRSRDDTVAADVRVVSGQPEITSPPFASLLQFAVELTPPTFQKLKVTAAYSTSEQEGQQRTFSAQDILDNESLLPGRVTRLPPTAEELAAGQPGKVTQVDITPFSIGKREDRSVSLSAKYSHATEEHGLFTLRATAQSRLSSRNEIDGVEVVSTSDQESPPQSNIVADGDWKFGAWGVGSTFTRVGAGRYAGAPYDSFWTLDAGMAYTIDKPFGGHVMKTLRLGFGIQNLFDADPPFADTLTGFRGGSALGRMYQLSLRAPLGS